LVDPAASVSDLSLVLDAAGLPLVGYHDWRSGDALLARWDGTWSLETVESTGSVGDGIAAAVDRSGRPALAYVDVTRRVVRFALKDGSTWTFEDAAASGFSSRLGLAFDSLDRAVIAYVGAGGPWLARREAAGWTQEPVGEYGSLGGVALDATDGATIAYL